MRSGQILVPVRVHTVEEIQRNLRRLEAYQALMLEEPPLPTPPSVLGDPRCCARHLLSAAATCFAWLERPRLASLGQPPSADYLAFALALLARVSYPSCPEVRALRRFRWELETTLGNATPAPEPLAQVHARVRRRVFDLLHRLRGRPPGRGVRALSLDIAASLYYVGDAIRLYRRLAPPAVPHGIHRPHRRRPRHGRASHPAEDPGRAVGARPDDRGAGGAAADGAEGDRPAPRPAPAGRVDQP